MSPHKRRGDGGCAIFVIVAAAVLTTAAITVLCVLLYQDWFR